MQLLDTGDYDRDGGPYGESVTCPINENFFLEEIKDLVAKVEDEPTSIEFELLVTLHSEALESIPLISHFLRLSIGKLVQNAEEEKIIVWGPIPNASEHDLSSFTTWKFE